MKNEIPIVVGRYPPPLGGVSVFVKRKFTSLKASGCRAVDFNDKFWLLKLLALALKDNHVFLLNTTRLPILFIFMFFGLLPKTIIYDHNSSRRLWGKYFYRLIYLFFCSRVRSIRVVHKHLIYKYEEFGVNNNIEVESPFIPPDYAGRNEIISAYPSSVTHFMNDTSYYRVIFAISRFNLDDRGCDIYGLRNAINLMESVVELNKNYRFMLAFGEFNRKNIPSDVINKINKLTEKNNLVLLCGQKDLWPVYECADLFLRLTSTDGESVSILEALHFGCIVLASDVVPRPAGVFLYKYGNDDDLASVFMKISTKV